MAVDTIKLLSPHLTDATTEAVRRRLMVHRTIHGGTGEILRTVGRGDVPGALGSAAAVSLFGARGDIKSTAGPNAPAATRHPTDCVVVLEGSVHKLLLGHNIGGGPLDPRAAARWLVAQAEAYFGADLPEADDWKVRQVDWAESFLLPQAAVQQYVRTLADAPFPRRTLRRFGDQSLLWPGSVSSIRVYDKAREFAANDTRRLKLRCTPEEMIALRESAAGILRAEVSIKARRLDEDFGHTPMVNEVTDSYVIRSFDQEMRRLLREGAAPVRTVRTHAEVQARLVAAYGVRLGGTLFGTWTRLAAFGEEATRATMSRPSFYRHRKQLEQAGVAWRGADVGVIEVRSALPEDFVPVRGDPRRLTAEHPRVQETLAPYRQRVA